jgi:hypothetical protein
VQALVLGNSYMDERECLFIYTAHVPMRPRAKIPMLARIPVVTAQTCHMLLLVSITWCLLLGVRTGQGRCTRGGALLALKCGGAGALEAGAVGALAVAECHRL